MDNKAEMWFSMDWHCLSSGDERILCLNWNLAEQDLVHQSNKGAFGLE